MPPQAEKSHLLLNHAGSSRFDLPLEHQIGVPQSPAKTPVGSCPLQRREKLNVEYYTLIMIIEKDSHPTFMFLHRALGNPSMDRPIKSSPIAIS